VDLLKLDVEGAELAALRVRRGFELLAKSFALCWTVCCLLNCLLFAELFAVC
jgi:hypothetical protein